MFDDLTQATADSVPDATGDSTVPAPSSVVKGYLVSHRLTDIPNLVSTLEKFLTRGREVSSVDIQRLQDFITVLKSAL